MRSDARMVAWQFEDLGALNVSVDDCNEAVQWIEPGGRVDSGPAAIASLLRSGDSRLWRSLGRTLQVSPINAAARPAYRWISRNRHRMPGGTPACSLPRTPSTSPVESGLKDPNSPKTGP